MLASRSQRVAATLLFLQAVVVVLDAALLQSWCTRNCHTFDPQGVTNWSVIVGIAATGLALGVFVWRGSRIAAVLALIGLCLEASVSGLFGFIALTLVIVGGISSPGVLLFVFFNPVVTPGLLAALNVVLLIAALSAGDRRPQRPPTAATALGPR